MSAELEAFERLPHGILQLSVEHGRRGREEYLITAFLSSVVHDPTAVHQDHHLVRSNLNAGTIGNDVWCALGVAAVFATLDLYTLCHDGVGTHVTGCDVLQPRICQCAANGTCCCTNQTHIDNLQFFHKAKQCKPTVWFMICE